ncbi:hypothetical protein [Roseimarinus sediminis]|uniref:hypothetical protein n=1 Tax=Roseimarinus sediminis TaxID=1610899 RepID=UPI003D1F171D
MKLFSVLMPAIPPGFLHQYLSENNFLYPLMLAGIYGLLVILISRLARKKQFDWSYIDSVNVG